MVLKPRKETVMFSSRRLIAVSAIVLLVLGLIMLCEGLVDTKSIRDQVVQVIKDKTGHDVTIKGSVRVSMIPLPTVVIPGIELRDENSESPAPSLTIDEVKLRISPFSMFSSHPDITSISLEDPLLELERGHDGNVHWDWLGAGLLKQPSTAGSNQTIAVHIIDGKIIYHNEVIDKIVSVENIVLNGHIGAQPDADGVFSVYGHAVRLSLGHDATAPDSMTLKLYGDSQNTLQWQGTADLSGDTPALKGKLTINSTNILPWLHEENIAKHEMIDTITNEATEKAKDTATFPLKLSADWDEQGLDLKLDNLTLQGLNSGGGGNVALAWNGNIPAFDIKLDFTALDYNQWRGMVDRLSDFEKEDTPAPIGYHSNDEPVENPLPKDMQVTLNLTAQQVYLGQQIWQHAQTLIKLDDASLTVDQFNVELPGDSTLSLFGVVSEGTTGSRGLRFEGSMETKGKSLRQMLTVFDESAKEMPDTGFGEFYARSNIFASPEQVRLSEADVQISDLHLNGGLVAYFDTNPRLEADVKLKDINFDYFRDVWRKSQKDNANTQDFFLKFDKGMSFNWLRKLQTTIDFRVSVDRFTFLDRKGSLATFRLFARENEFGIYDIHLSYPGEMTEANLKLDVSSGQPNVNLLLNTSELNTDYFSVTPDPKKDTEPATNAAKAPTADAPPVPAAPDASPAPKDEDKTAATPTSPVKTEDKPAAAPDATPAKTDGKPAAVDATKADGKKVDMVPQAEHLIELAQEQPSPVLPGEAKTIEDLPGGAAAPAPKPADGATSEAPKKRWSEDLIDMSWMEGISGTFDISIGKLKHGSNTFDNFKMRAQLANNLLSFQTLSFMYWQGKCDIVGSLYGGTVPGMSISYTLYDNDLHDILKSLVGWDNIGGRISISGTLATSGVNYLSWVSQSEAKLVVAGRGVLINGLNLPGVVNAVQVSRTASDVLNNVNLALLNGSTEFNVDGNLNVKNGTIRTPGITLKTGDITGNLTGEVDLVPWTIALSALFQFPTMTSETVPTMALQWAGPIEHGQLQSDTASLEAYVAKRIVGR